MITSAGAAQLYKCTACGVEYPRWCFYPSDLAAWMITGEKVPLNCTKCRKELRENKKAKNPDGAYFRHIKKHYGVLQSTYVAQLKAQNGACLLCHEPPSLEKRETHLRLDRDKSTGAVRGLLCSGCMTSINLLRHSLVKYGDEYVTDLLSYLVKDEENVV